MKITLQGIGKRFTNREWVIRNLDFTFQPNEAYALIGSNGSGKSTLARIITGISPPSVGSVSYSLEGKPLQADTFYKHLTYAAPYLDLVEELTLEELLHFHFNFKKIADGYTIQSLIEKMYLTQSRKKQIVNFSSGMKQRLKLGLALYSQAHVTLLDEPTSNMDEKGIAWYAEQIEEVLNKRTLIIASNQPNEYEFTQQLIDLN